MTRFSTKELQARAQVIAERICAYSEYCIHVERQIPAPIKIYGIPRGGIPAAYLVARFIENALVVDAPDEADVFVDDIIDSGATRDRYYSTYNKTPFYALIDKTGIDANLEWCIFPWEADSISGIEDNISRLLQFIGEDPMREGLRETPARVAKAWGVWAEGYKQDPADVLKIFEDGAENVDQMVIVKDIPFYSHCEHHLAPFFGTISIGYLPKGKVVGISKLARVADIFARRLQVQERLTQQIANALMENLEPFGVGVIVKARHLCMESRGVSKIGQETVTSALLGTFLKRDVRTEFFCLSGA